MPCLISSNKVFQSVVFVVVVFEMDDMKSVNLNGLPLKPVPCTVTYFIPEWKQFGYNRRVSCKLVSSSSSPPFIDDFSLVRTSFTRPNGYASALLCGVPSVTSAATVLALYPSYNFPSYFIDFPPRKSRAIQPPALCPIKIILVSSSSSSSSLSFAGRNATASSIASKIFLKLSPRKVTGIHQSLSIFATETSNTSRLLSSSKEFRNSFKTVSTCSRISR
mmetsp:Transcript_974/g.3603  ORF Transcript_974/g.3603 Transcript_974/m.3603 type:complete len:220 (-) Transcript_974:199-858(-)